jgi:hypothetical protein
MTQNGNYKLRSVGRVARMGRRQNVNHQSWSADTIWKLLEVLLQIIVTQGMNKRRAFANSVMNFRVPQIESVDHPSDYQFLKKDSAAWDYLTLWTFQVRKAMTIRCNIVSNYDGK